MSGVFQTLRHHTPASRHSKQETISLTIDNDYYNRVPTAWRDESQPLSFLDGMTPGRFAYLSDVLAGRMGMNLSDITVLDVGCGGGLLAEEFASVGSRVIGVDPSEPSLLVARAHAAEVGLAIEYVHGMGESLPLEDKSFDVVYCCDVLEHVADLDRVTAEISRVLKPNGVYLYDTINRTLISRLLLIKAAQDWKPTRVVDFPLHVWTMFIEPTELHAVLARHGLENQETVGFGPKVNPVKVLTGFLNLKRGRISYAALARSLNLGIVRSLSLLYIGYAVKRAQPTK